MNKEITTSPAFAAAITYEQFYVANIFRYWTPLFLQKVLPHPGDRLLDLACGTGVVARSAVPIVGPGGKVVGLDINPSMLSVACQQFSEYCNDVEWQEGTAENLPFPDQSFDLVLCQQGLQFFQDRQAAGREMRRILRPGGRAGIEVWQSLEKNPFMRTVFEVMAAIFEVPFDSLAKPFSFGDAGQLGSMLEQSGFRPVTVEPARLDVHFPEPENFIALTIRGAAAVIPVFAQLEGEKRQDLVARVNHEIAGLIDDHTQAGVLTFPMGANIAIGTC